MKWKYSVGGYEIVIERKYGYGTKDDIRIVLIALAEILREGKVRK